MKRIAVSQDIIPLGEFKSSISKWMNMIKTSGHPLIITQNGKPAGVLLSPAEYDDLVYSKHFIRSVEKGISDADAGNVYTTEELLEELTKRRETRISK